MRTAFARSTPVHRRVGRWVLRHEHFEFRGRMRPCVKQPVDRNRTNVYARDRTSYRFVGLRAARPPAGQRNFSSVLTSKRRKLEYVATPVIAVPLNQLMSRI